MLETDEIRLAEVKTVRRQILRLLHATGPVGANEKTLFTALQCAGYPVLSHEIRKYLDYLESLKAIEVVDRDRATWSAKILPYGIDIVEFAVKAPPGIAKE
ncbi:MAG: hypothetical protein CVV41_06755 [Candidatus Riflebacteria bacterium HGW-Riflebacteria-1]|jgi:hypothetical protein|nr:MAG: hypothetical protein CVV41_06755 [Candidatus Riflebacteria bacterium HGW-Riflebacteria-1]